MALNLDAIRRKMAELSGDKRNSNFWYPEVGEYVIRALPWAPDKTSEGTPFIERYFYYIGSNKAFLAPKQFGDEDPVNELSRSLWSSKKPEDKEAAKKIMPKMKAYLPVLVKGEEAKGIQLYAFGKDVYNRLLELMCKEDIGDYTDPTTGFNLEVSVKNTDRKYNGKTMTATTIDASRKQTKLVSWFGNDEAKMQEALKKFPDVDAIYPRKSTTEINRMLTEWLNEGLEPTKDAGTARGGSVVDELDKLENELNTKSKVVETVEKTTKKSKKVEVDDDDEVVPTKSTKTLDDAFNELENE